MPKSILEFMLNYVARETTREEVLTNETTLTNPNNAYLSTTDAAILARLNETEIFDAFKRDGVPPEAVENIRVMLRALGFDAPTANAIIHGQAAQCQPGAPTAMSSLGVAAYGAGEVHLRKIWPRKAKAGTTARFELAGQGFRNDVEVRFVEYTAAGDGDVIPGVIRSRHADIDVHQYLNVTAEFPERDVETKWRVELLDHNKNPAVWVPFNCPIIVEPS